MFKNNKIQRNWFTWRANNPTARLPIEKQVYKTTRWLSTTTLFVILTMSVTLCGCGIYTFNGSTLPTHIKTVDIPLFLNNSLEPGIADEVTQELNNKILSDNQLRVISNRGDATIRGEITSYSNEPHSYGTTDAQKLDVEQYIVKIDATVDFIDNKKDNSIFKGSVIGEGIYDFKSEKEATGREKAKQEIVRKILEKSIQSW